ncbi:MAG TPA: CPBP family intramembrane glutamic endopeptidase [Pyrinomonadaceae bacterium]
MAEQVTSFTSAAPAPTETRSTVDPSNPPWGLLQASLAWLASVILLWLVPQFCAIPYIATHYRGMAPTKELLLNDKTFILILVAGFLPAHVLTLLLAWAIASRLGKFSPLQTLGFNWPRNFGLWKSTAVAIVLFLLAMLIISKFGGQDTDLERILRSSRAAALITAFVAAGTAPLVEEVIYRGLLYSALQRVAGAVAAVAIVTLTFAGLHVLQYWPNAGAIAAISLLSLILTVVRARTGRLLPCYIIHLVFNGIQSVIIVADPYIRPIFETPHPDAAPAILHFLVKLL